MSKLYSWVKKSSSDIANYKQKKFTYTYRGVSSEKAFWVFDLNSEYKPGKGIMRDRILVAFDFGVMNDTVIKKESNHIDFESSAFKGETKHKTQVIVKSNERGAYGIGAMIRGFLTVSSISLATNQEVAKALGLNIREITTRQTW